MRTRVGAVTVAALAARAGVAGKGVLAAGPWSGFGEAVIGGLIVALLGLAIVATLRRPGRANRDPHHTHALAADDPEAPELVADASRTLVAADDAVLTSEQELGFAIAVFGEHAMAPFSRAVGSARGELREAFRLWQLVVDNAADGAGTQSLLTEIRHRCDTASSLLDEQASAFDEALNVVARAPQLVAEIDAHIAQQSGRMRQSEQVLDRLSAKYTPEAIAAVAANPDHAATRLEFAAGCLASAERALAAEDVGHAAVLLQSAEAGADQATDLLTGVLHMEAELTQAASGVPAALREIDAEIAEATALLTGTADEQHGALVAGARAVSDNVRAKLAAGAFDALVALRDLQQADADLDRVLSRPRTEQARRQRATAVLDEAMLVARSSVTSAEDYITTRRGGVGIAARASLAAAWRHYRQAISLGQADPEAALTEAQDADTLARPARDFAERDVAQFDGTKLNAAGIADWSGWATGAGAGLHGAILGGILIEASAGGVGPGSFGGVGTRDRHTIWPGRVGGPGIADRSSVSGSV